jgi:hypothetical protein
MSRFKRTVPTCALGCLDRESVFGRQRNHGQAGWECRARRWVIQKIGRASNWMEIEKNKASRPSCDLRVNCISE